MAGEGFIVYSKQIDKVCSSHFPALSVNPLDVAGAGDSLLSVLAIGLASNQNIFDVAAIACCMTQLAVETMGNTPITKDALRSHVVNVFNS